MGEQRIEVKGVFVWMIGILGFKSEINDSAGVRIKKLQKNL